MRENTVARAVRITGWCIIIGGIIGAFVLGYALPAVTYGYYGGAAKSYNWGLTLGVIIGSVISGMLFQAVAEIIRLLQMNVDRMDDLIRSTGGQTDNHSGSTLRDIESNLPRI